MWVNLVILLGHNLNLHFHQEISPTQPINHFVENSQLMFQRESELLQKKTYQLSLSFVYIGLTIEIFQTLVVDV